MSDVDKQNYRGFSYKQIASHHTSIVFIVATKQKKKKKPSQVPEGVEKKIVFGLPCRAYNNASSGTVFRNTLYTTRFPCPLYRNIVQLHIIHFLYSTSNGCNNNNFIIIIDYHPFERKTASAQYNVFWTYLSA